jgi:hypothetical protein
MRLSELRSRRSAKQQEYVNAQDLFNSVRRQRLGRARPPWRAGASRQDALAAARRGPRGRPFCESPRIEEILRAYIA